MSVSRVEKFNCIVGNSPVGLEDKDLFWEQATLQAKLVLEEAQEQYDACLVRDLTEVVDGACDVRYLQDFMNTLLQACGVQLEDAFESVCGNNEGKYTTDYEVAILSASSLCQEGVLCHVAKTEFFGEVFYTVKRDADGKVLKLIGHTPPNIKATIPAHTYEVLCG